MEAVAVADVVLLMADSNFINLCKDPVEYLGRLKALVAQRRTNGVQLYTVSGRYGVNHIDSSIEVVQLDDRNKTIFGQTLENSSMLFDELLVVTVSASDPYIAMAKEVMMNASKTITQYGYIRK